MRGPGRLHYVRRGNGPPLLLVQGAAATHLHWGERLLSELAKSFDVVAYDHRGVGGSAPIQDSLTMVDMADDAAGLLDELGWEGSAAFGVSLGGVVAQELALRHPGRLETLILGCTTTGGDHHLAGGNRAQRDAVAASIVRGDSAATARNLLHLGVKDQSSLPPDVWLEYRFATLSLPVHPRTTVLQVDALARHSTAARLGLLQTPTLVLHGDSDRIVDPARGAAVAKAIAGSELMILPAGHFFWLEQPTQVARAIAEFCGDSGPRGPAQPAAAR